MIIMHLYQAVSCMRGGVSSKLAIPMIQRMALLAALSRISVLIKVTAPLTLALPTQQTEKSTSPYYSVFCEGNKGKQKAMNEKVQLWL